MWPSEDCTIRKGSPLLAREGKLSFDVAFSNHYEELRASFSHEEREENKTRH